MMLGEEEEEGDAKSNRSRIKKPHLHPHQLINLTVSYKMDVGTLFQKFLEQEKKKKRRHDDDDDDDAKLDAFFTTPPKTKRMSRKKRQCQIRKLMKQAKSIIEGISEGNNDDDDDDVDDKKIIGGGENSKKKRKKVVPLSRKTL